MSNILKQPSIQLDHPLYWVGVDGGGTQCRASIYDENNHLLGRGIGGSANPVNGIEQTQQTITQAISDAVKDAKLDCQLEQLIIGAGLAGLHLPSAKQDMQDWKHPFHSLHLTTDIHTAVLGAHQNSDGAVIILGTGFSALGLVKERQIPIGGYGFPINATGSGSWFGLELVKAVLLDADGIGPKTSMSQSILANESIISMATRMNNGLPAEFAKYAPIVFEHAKQGDYVAEKLVKQAAIFVERVMQRLLDEGVQHVSFVGGVAPHIQPWLNSQMNEYILEAKSSPEYGALLYSQQKHKWLIK